MTVFLAILLTVITFAFVAYPLFRQRWAVVNQAEDERLSELNSRRDTTYSMLKELEFDFQSGILSEEDYRELETRYKSRAISILRDIDGLEKNTGIEEEVERQIQELRRNSGRVNSSRVKSDRVKGRFCPQCGTQHEEGDRFCARCGEKLTPGDTGD